MTGFIVHAKPRSVAIAAALPMLIAVAALAARPAAPGPPLAFAVALYTGVLMVLVWSWVVGGAVNARIPPQHRPPTAVFRLAVIFLGTYLAAFLTLTFGAEALPIGRSPAVLFALQLLALMASFEIVRFIGTNLSRAEAAAGIAPASSVKAALALTSVAGILFVQKRVNRLFEARDRRPPLRGAPGR